MEFPPQSIQKWTQCLHSWQNGLWNIRPPMTCQILNWKEEKVGATTPPPPPPCGAEWKRQWHSPCRMLHQRPMPRLIIPPTPPKRQAYTNYTTTTITTKGHHSPWETGFTSVLHSEVSQSYPWPTPKKNHPRLHGTVQTHPPPEQRTHYPTEIFTPYSRQQVT